jgi:hypothetical protein
MPMSADDAQGRPVQTGILMTFPTGLLGRLSLALLHRHGAVSDYCAALGCDDDNGFAP